MEKVIWNNINRSSYIFINGLAMSSTMNLKEICMDGAAFSNSFIPGILFKYG